jgi:diacylglycerol kinase family enzyme
LSPGSPPDVFESLPRLTRTGKINNIPQYITHVRTTELAIEAKNEETINLDGEIEHGEAHCFPDGSEGINYIFPKDMAFI